jgi:ABC-type sugar transport system substrate-binding protein
MRSSFMQRAARLAALLAWVAVGCGPPPPPPGAADPDGPTATPEITMVLPPGATDDPDMVLWLSTAMVEAGREQLVFTAETPKASDPPERQAALVQAAARREAAVVIVVPPTTGETSASLAQAVVEASDAGTRVVILGPGLEIAGPNIVTIALPNLDRAADALVAALTAAVKRLGREEKPWALIVDREREDTKPTPRALTIQNALTRSGIDRIRRIAVPAEITLMDGLKSIRDQITASGEGIPSLIVAVDPLVLESASRLRTQRMQLNEAPDYALGGFVNDPVQQEGFTAGWVSAVIDLNPRRAAIEAVRAAVQLVRGEDVPARVEVPAPTEITTPNPGMVQPSNPRPSPALD